jgi:hypothetical protein
MSAFDAVRVGGNAGKSLECPSRPNHRADAEHARSPIGSVMSAERHSVAQQVEQSILLLMPAGMANVQR